MGRLLANAVRPILEAAECPEFDTVGGDVPCTEHSQSGNDQDFHAALRNVAESRSAAGTVSNDRLGRWLKMNEGKIVNGLKLKSVGRSGGYPIWKLIHAERWT